MDQIINSILVREGSAYTDRPSDRGGPTKYGITLKTLRHSRPSATAADVQNLTEHEAREIYEQDYIVIPHFDRLPTVLRPLLVDFGVTSGPGTASRALQTAIGAERDGLIGEDTLALLAKANVDLVYASVLRQYHAHFVSVVLADPHVSAFRVASPDTQLENLRGWLNRAGEFIR